MSAPAPFFRQVGALTLYELSSDGDAGVPGFWAGYRPGAGTVFPTPQNVPLDQVWQDAGGLYLFLGQTPADAAGFALFLGQLDALIPRASGDTTRFLWIANPLDPPGNWQLQFLRAKASGSGAAIAWKVARPAQFALGDYAVALTAGTALTQADPTALGYGVAADAAGFALVAPGGGYAPDAGSSWLPLAGASVGAWRARLSIPAPATPPVDPFACLRVLVRYAAPQHDGAAGDPVDTLDLAVFQQGTAGFALHLAFDPLNPLLADRSRLGFFADDGSGPAPVFGATYRTSRGYATQLAPKVASAPLRSARLAFCRSPLFVCPDPAATSWSYHLTPDGAFGLSTVPPTRPAGAPPAIDPTTHRLMFGLSGLEYATIPTGTSVIAFFAAGQPAFAPAAAPEAAPPAEGALPLTEDATTAYVAFLPASSGAAGLTYYAQPRQAPLFAGGSALGTGMLDFIEVPSAVLPTWTAGSGSAPAALPAGPFAGAPTDRGALGRRVEQAALAPRRRALIGLPPARMALTADGNDVLAVTPQGLVVEVGATQLDAVVMANMPATPQQRLDFTTVGPRFQAALQANELFFVAANPEHFLADPSPGPVQASVRYCLDAKGLLLAAAAGVPQTVIDAVRAIVMPGGGPPVIYGTEAAFTAAISGAAGGAANITIFLSVAGYLKAVMSGWTFQLSPRSWRAPTSGSPTVMLFKFCNRDLESLVDDIPAWGWPEAGILPVDGGTRAATRKVIQDLFDAARARAEDPKAEPGDPYARFYREVVSNPLWNGALFLNAPVDFTSMPPELQFLAAGIDVARFYAHHVGFSVTPFDPTTNPLTLLQTSAFGLIDYQDPVDLVKDATVPLAFKTLSLRARFANAQIAEFSARAELMTNRFFDAPAAKQDPTHGNNLVLDGSLQRVGGLPSYAFVLAGKNLYDLANSSLVGTEVLGVRLNTAAGGGVETVTTQFILGGNLRFYEPPGFDLYGYGPVPGPPVADGYLRFDNLIVTMAFPLATPSVQSFAATDATLSFDLANSAPRPDSLVANFPLALTGFVSSPNTAASGQPPAGRTPEDMGFASISAPMGQTPMSAPWRGLVYTLDLGTLGALAGSVGLKVQLLAAWCQGTPGADLPAYLGLKLPDTSAIGGSFPLQGVLRLSFRSFQFSTYLQGGRRAYLLRLRRFALTLLGWSFPPGNLDVYLFGGDDGRSTNALGWLMAYDQGEAKKKAALAARAAGRPEPHAQPRAERLLRRRRAGRRAPAAPARTP